MPSSTPQTAARRHQKFAVNARVAVELITTPWPALERRLLVRVGDLHLLDEPMSDIAKARALELLPRLGLDDSDLHHIQRAIEELQ